MQSFDGYHSGGFFDEFFQTILPVGRNANVGTGDSANPVIAKIASGFAQLSLDGLEERTHRITRDLHALGITFLMIGDASIDDRVLPFDVIPRLIPAQKWDQLQRGLIQRITALNLFLHDIYHDQHILRDGVVPAELVHNHPQFLPEMKGVDLNFGTYVHIAGLDLVRDAAGDFYVLEDNCRCPSGVSYVIENRQMMRRYFPEIMRMLPLGDVIGYPQKLRQAMHDVAPCDSEPVCVLLSPGRFNSAYFEHVFLAREMGIPLVEGSDLCVEDDKVYVKTTSALQQVHVIYRRISDDFLDPEVFRADSLLGVPGLMRAYRKGHVALVNAPGAGVADDKALYAYVPRIIKYYLDQDALLPNVPTYLCRASQDLAYVQEHLAQLVVKPVDEAGGYGILIGPQADQATIEEYRARITARPEAYIAQPLVELSVCPSLCEGKIQPRHVDLRPFIVTGKESWVLPGGLTRVALQEGKIIVNSSQGGGTKDSWVLLGKEDMPTAAPFSSS